MGPFVVKESYSPEEREQIAHELNSIHLVLGIDAARSYQLFRSEFSRSNLGNNSVTPNGLRQNVKPSNRKTYKKIIDQDPRVASVDLTITDNTWRALDLARSVLKVLPNRDGLAALPSLMPFLPKDFANNSRYIDASSFMHGRELKITSNSLPESDPYKATFTQIGHTPITQIALLVKRSHHKDLNRWTKCWEGVGAFVPSPEASFSIEDLSLYCLVRKIRDRQLAGFVIPHICRAANERLNTITECATVRWATVAAAI